MAVLDINIGINGVNKVSSLEQRFNALEKQAKKTTKSTNGLSSSIKTIAISALAYITVDKLVSSVASLASSAVITTAKFEQFNTVLRTIEGSSEKAEQSMAWIQDFAKTTPFELDKVTQSFVSLRAFGLNPTDGLLRTLGDTASAMGKDIQQAVEAIADAVVGENERLKEFGIRASRSAEETRFSWTNASGQAREAIVANNSEVIESTLEAIFNSKYEGAMAQQSKTWNGMISNMKDSWTIFTTEILDAGLFDYLKAIVSAFSESLTTAFDDAKNGAEDFAKSTIEVIKSVIGGVGYLYDSIEAFGDELTIVKNLGEVAFYGLSEVVTSFASSSVKAFESVFNIIGNGFKDVTNDAISWINKAIELANRLPNVNIGTIDTKITFTDKDFSSTVAKIDALNKEAEKQKDKNIQELKEATTDLFTIGGGQKFTDKLLKDIESKYSDILNSVDDSVAKTDFGNAFGGTDDTFNLQDEIQKQADFTQSVLDNYYKVDDAIQDTSDSISDFNDVLFKDDDSTNDNITNITDSFNDFNESANNVDYSTNQATKALDKFIFRFENNFINSLSNNISSLESIVSAGAGRTKSYQEALSDVLAVQDELKDNPLSVSIGNEFKSAYDAFIGSSTDFLQTSNFSSARDLEFAQSTFNRQSSGFETTAGQTVSVLDSMNNFLQSINQAFADGILSDEEKATIAGVATDVNAKNEMLLGAGQTNSVSTNLMNMMGTDGGISLNSIGNALGSLQVATGLDGNISNLAISNIGIESKTAKNSTTNRQGYGVTGETAQYSTIPYTTLNSIGSPVTSFVRSFAGVTHSYGKIDLTGSDTGFAAGGFTGNGQGQKDSSGFKQAGIVHEGEYVAPKWMVDSQPQIFNALESARKSKGFAQGGYTSTTKTSNNNGMEQVMSQVLKEQQNLYSLFSRLTQKGTIMPVELVA